MATGWDITAVLKLVFSCFFEVAFFWQLVRLRVSCGLE
jgi:hypothetical protein